MMTMIDALKGRCLAGGMLTPVEGLKLIGEIEVLREHMQEIFDFVGAYIEGERQKNEHPR